LEVAEVGTLFDNPLWLSENVLLAHSRFADGFFLTPYELNLNKRHLTIQPQYKGITQNTKGGWQLSTDHRWMLWRRGWLENHYDFVATRRDGRVSVHWTVKHADSEGPFFWLPGTHRWMHLLLQNHNSQMREAQIFDLDHPHRKQVIPLLHLYETRLLGFLPDGSLLLTNWEDADTKRFHFATLQLVNNRVTARSWKIALPDDGQSAQICLSPDGKRLVWLMQEGATRGKDGLHADAKQATLYVSRTDGRHRHVLGTIPFAREGDAYNTFLHGWFPDNQQVLIQFHTRLYAVPVPEQAGKRS
jgi:hypothetical protein